jgi:hypothetical protein
MTIGLSPFRCESRYVWRLGSAGRSIFEARLAVVRSRQPVKGEETSTVVGPLHERLSIFDASKKYGSYDITRPVRPSFIRASRE